MRLSDGCKFPVKSYRRLPMDYTELRAYVRPGVTVVGSHAGRGRAGLRQLDWNTQVSVNSSKNGKD